MTYATYLVDDKGDLLLYPAEAAERIGIGVFNLRRYADMGVLRYKKTSGGHRRYFPISVENLAVTVAKQRATGDRRFKVNK